MGYPTVIMTSHKIAELINQGRFVVTQARCLQYVPLLTYPAVTIKRCSALNPAMTVPFEFEGECVAETRRYTKLRPDLESSPIQNADVIYFVDGWCS